MRKIKKKVSIILVVAFMLSMMPVSPMTEPVYATGGFAGGDGSESAPYQIATVSQLNQVENCNSKLN